MTHFILMLTKDDCTVPNANEVYAKVRETRLTYVGFKDIGMPLARLATLADSIHADGREVMLEVVSTNRHEELQSVRAAIDIGVDYLLGGRHVVDVLPLLVGTGIRYFPFCGETVGHPTKLVGTAEAIDEDARRLAALPGVHGLDLLSYRFAGDAAALTRRVVSAVALPVIAAGSIDRPERVRAMRDAGVWGFTIGSAFFEGRFIDDMLGQQIRSVARMEGVST
jgi:hypothetical protein